MEETKRVIALGFFDGIHVGHQALMNKTKERAAQLGVTPAVISFDTHPDNMVMGKNIELINTDYDRVDLIRRVCGIDDIIFLHFDEELMHMGWEDFIMWLIDGFNAVHLVAGYDFSFGYKGQGNPDRLRAKCAELGLGCDIVPKIELDGVTVSSTLIRSLLKTGKVQTVNKYLGHPHSFTDFVRNGYKFGRKIGVPTINMRFPEGMVEMVHGVYATKARLEDGREFLAITNVGVRPTMGGTDRISVESHLLGYSGNLYGQRVRIDFYWFLRPEVKFSDPAQLRARIFADIEDVKEFFAGREGK